MAGAVVIFVYALVKGTAEGHVGRHFGSLRGILDHADRAIALGLLTDGPDGWHLTATGRILYDRHLVSLPRGRAYIAWDDDILQSVGLTRDRLPDLTPDL